MFGGRPIDDVGVVDAGTVRVVAAVLHDAVGQAAEVPDIEWPVGDFDQGGNGQGPFREGFPPDRDSPEGLVADDDVEGGDDTAIGVFPAWRQAAAASRRICEVQAGDFAFELAVLA